MKKQSLLDSFGFAIEGVFTAIKSERNLKIHFIVMAMVVIGGFVCHLSVYEWIACLLLFIIVISAEMFNTAIEAVVDIVMPHQHKLAKTAKDVAAGAVLITAIGAVIIGLLIFLPKIIQMFG